MIPEEYKFCTFGEFYVKRDNISIWYDTLDDKCKYKYYVYSRPRRTGLEDFYVDAIWNWLNFIISDKEMDRYYDIWRFIND